jgi:hypothetical protein
MAFFKLIPTLYADSSPESPLSLAVSAIAYAYLGTKHHESSSELVARSEYCKTLRKVNSELQAPSIIEKEDIFVTVGLLLLYEALTSPRGHNYPFKWLQHLQGAIARLKLRGCRRFKSHAGQLAADVVMVQMILSSLTQRRKPPIPLYLWGVNVPAQVPGKGLVNMMYQVAEASAAIHKIITTPPNIDTELSKEAVLGLIGQLEALDTSLLTWEKFLPDTWQYYAKSTSTQNERTSASTAVLGIMGWPGAPSNEYVYTASHFVFPHCIYFATRVILSHNIVSAITWMTQNFYLLDDNDDDHGLIQVAQKKQDREVLMAVLTETICGSVPALLGHYSCTAAPSEPVTPPFSMPSSPFQSPLPHQQPEDPNEWRVGPRGLFTLWPLRTAFNAVQNEQVKQIVGLELKEWIVHILSLVFRLTGIPQR